MGAIRGNIINQSRSCLQDVIPLETPYSVVIDPCNVCNFKCNFCAVQKAKNETSFKRGMMSPELFRKIIDDMKEFPDRLKVLRLTGCGEPMLNADFPNMIEYAKQKGISDFIETVTNGSCLTPQLNTRLAQCGLDRIRISIEAITEEGYKETSSVQINYERLLEQINDLYDKCKGHCEIYIKTVDAAVKTKEDQERFYSLFEDKCDKIFIDKVIPLWTDWSDINDYYDIEKDSGLHGQEVKHVSICPYPFYSCIINIDGEVTACCADWKRMIVFGNVSNNSLYDIWNGNRMKRFWIEMLKDGRSSIEMCRKCALPDYDCNDDIDSYSKQILNRVTVRGV